MKEQFEAKRLAILRAAFDVVSAKGYSDTKVDDIAAGAGVAKGTVYLYFKDKPAIYVGLADWLLEQAVAVIRDTAARPLSPRAKLALIFEDWSKTLLSRPAVMSLLSMQNVDQTTEVMHRFRKLVMPHMREMVKEIAAIVADGIRAGEFRRVDPQVAALMYLDSFRTRMFALAHGIVDRDPGPMVQELFFCGILANAGSRSKRKAG